MPGNPTVLTVVGLGAMGGGITLAALLAGFSVRVVDSDERSTVAGLARLTERLRRHVSDGILEDSASGLIEQVTMATSIDDACAGVDLVVEAVSEDRTIKRSVLSAVSAVTSAVIATNTSSLPIDELATDVQAPERFLGVHFFHPAEWIPGVEVVPGTVTSPGSIELAMSLLGRMRKKPTTVKDSAGFLANRLQLALFLECLRCVDEGLATPADIDRVVTSTFGFRLSLFGPFAIADMAGLDVYASILATLRDAFGERFTIPTSLQKLVGQNRFGVKNGAGFADYSLADAAALTSRRDGAYLKLLLSTGAPHPQTVAVPEGTS